MYTKDFEHDTMMQQAPRILQTVLNFSKYPKFHQYDICPITRKNKNEVCTNIDEAYRPILQQYYTNVSATFVLGLKLT